MEQDQRRGAELTVQTPWGTTLSANGTAAAGGLVCSSNRKVASGAGLRGRRVGQCLLNDEILEASRTKVCSTGLGFVLRVRGNRRT